MSTYFATRGERTRVSKIRHKIMRCMSIERTNALFCDYRKDINNPWSTVISFSFFSLQTWRILRVAEFALRRRITICWNFHDPVIKHRAIRFTRQPRETAIHLTRPFCILCRTKGKGNRSHPHGFNPRVFPLACTGVDYSQFISFATDPFFAMWKIFATIRARMHRGL